jgi:PEGA domain
MRFAPIFLIAAASLAATTARGENAVPRNSGGSSSDRDRNHAGGAPAPSGASSSSQSSPSSSPSSSSPSASSSDSARPRTQAEKDHPRAGSGTGDRRNNRGHHGGGGYYGGHNGGGYWNGGIWVTGGCYDCYDPLYYPRYRSYRYYDDGVPVRVQVKPEETRVYVDGYYAGVADDFDGILQRLYISRGQHEIAMKLEGFRSHRFLVYGVPGRTIKLHYNMVQGSGDDAAEDLAGGHPPVLVPRGHDDDGEEEDDAPAAPVVRESGDSGKLSLDVRPGDAAVYIDGRLHPEAAEDEVRLASGLHRVEVVRPGYVSFERELEIRPGKTADLDVHLEKK